MKCLCCQELFRPDRRNAHHQEFCTKPECRKESKGRSQARWLARPENQNHFRGSANITRVQEWRKLNPGYWKKTPRERSRTLQDLCPGQPADKEATTSGSSPDPSLRTLQDLCRDQVPLFVGLISQLVGSPLQEDIASYLRLVIAKGNDLLDPLSGVQRNQKSNTYDLQTSPPAGSTPAHSTELQLGGSSTHSPTAPAWV